jgi:DNA integrity scanning protein DisA with diadenylate cyclase activity
MRFVRRRRSIVSSQACEFVSLDEANKMDGALCSSSKTMRIFRVNGKVCEQ